MSDYLDLPFAEAHRIAMREFREAYAQRRLDAAGGNVSEAARCAGMDRANFRRLRRRPADEQRAKLSDEPGR